MGKAPRIVETSVKSKQSYNPADDSDDTAVSRQTIELFFTFLTSRTGMFLKKPLVHELAEAIDGMASIGETNLLNSIRLPPLPGMKGPVNARRMQEVQLVMETFQAALQQSTSGSNHIAVMQLARELMALLNDERLRQNAGPILEEIQSVIQLVAVEVLEIRGSRMMRSVLKIGTG
jgi:membrane protein insertase Oxa1/YidC/SpoIIIJ